MVRTALFSALFVATIACQGQGGSQSMVIGGMQSQNAVQGRMSAEMPIVGSVEGQLTNGFTYEHGGRMGYEFHRATSDGWAMVGGMLDVDGLPNGETVELSPEETGTFGCSGPQEWMADFDEPAEKVFVTKEERLIDGEIDVELTITATFGPNGELTVVVVPPANGGRNNEG